MVSCESMGIISYVYARSLILIGYKSYLSYGHNVSVKSPSLDSVPVVYEFPNVFPTDLPGIPPAHGI